MRNVQLAYVPSNGSVELVDAPIPEVGPGWVIVRNAASLVSAGTERMKIETGSQGLIGKARARPDLVKKVIDKARSEGPLTALSAARDRLAALTPLGYSSAGTIVGVGSGVAGVAVGDRVACGGAGWANHALYVSVPANLVARIPDGLPADEAAYATVGAIALHGFRQADVSLGESVAVVGLGLVGQLTAAIASAAGCHVIGIDPDPRATDLAQAGGIETIHNDDPDLASRIAAMSRGAGADATIICASTSTPEPVALAVTTTRERGRIVIVGDVPVTAPRSDLYEKELEIRLARSYGAGRYDRDYEIYGHDLPVAYVRWSEGRNIGAFLDLVASERVDVKRLTTHRFALEDAVDAYTALTAKDGERAIGIVLEYPDAEAPTGVAVSRPMSVPRTTSPRLRIGVIGPGSHARSSILPHLKRSDVELAAVASASGLTATDVARRYGFSRDDSTENIIDDPNIDAVVISSSHSSHASIAARALASEKAVFVEKPLATTAQQLLEVEAAIRPDSILFVGFNRRFAPAVESLRGSVTEVPNRSLLARVNAGPLPADHWLNDVREGGGRLLGEGCHFVDLLSWLAGSPTRYISGLAALSESQPAEASQDVIATLQFASGAVGSLVYSGSGDTSLPKERIEVHGAGWSAVIDDFRRLELYRNGKRSVSKGRRDKGHARQMAAFIDTAAGRTTPPEIDSYLNSSWATLALVEAIRTRSVIDVAGFRASADSPG